MRLAAILPQYGVLCLALLFAGNANAERFRYIDRTIEEEGIRLRLRVEAIEDNASEVPQAGQNVRLLLDGHRLADGQPLEKWSIGAWLDRETDAMSGAVPVCGQRVARYLSGNLMQRPLMDLTGYYVLSLDAEPSISVLDPSVTFGGRSSLHSAIKLDGQGFDWAKTSDDALLFVALPNEKKLAIVDLQTLKVQGHLTLQGQPTRLALQPDERLLWVGQAGTGDEASAVDVIDTMDGRQVAHIRLPLGHHEFDFSEDGRYTYVSSRRSRTLTIIDTSNFNIVNDVRLGFEPLGVIFVDKTSGVWVVDSDRGRIHRYGQQGYPIDSWAVEPGFGPAKVTPDSRHVVAINPSKNRLYILDAVTGEQKLSLAVPGQPYDLIFTARYAYIRSLQSEQVGVLPLSGIDNAEAFIKFVPAGALPVAQTANLPRASSMTASLDNAGAFFVTPSERTIYHYMEGMNSPSSGVRTYGHVPMAAMIIQRGLREVGPGQYETVVRLPSAGRMVLALASETPILRKCIGLKIEPEKKWTREPDLGIQWLSEGVQKVTPGTPLHFRLAVKNVEDVALAKRIILRLRIVPAHGGGAAVFWPLEADTGKPGEWEAVGTIFEDGSYYVHVEGEPAIRSVYATVIVSGKSNEGRGEER
jgi:DNA-binding beta-propeller fold protein YncE